MVSRAPNLILLISALLKLIMQSGKLTQVLLLARIPEGIFKSVLSGQPSAVTQSIGNGVCPLSSDLPMWHLPLAQNFAWGSAHALEALCMGLFPAHHPQGLCDACR